MSLIDEFLVQKMIFEGTNTLSLIIKWSKHFIWEYNSIDATSAMAIRYLQASTQLWKSYSFCPGMTACFHPCHQHSHTVTPKGDTWHIAHKTDRHRKTLFQLSSQLPLDLIENKARKGARCILGILCVCSSTLGRESGLFQCGFRYFKLPLFTSYIPILLLDSH